MRRLVAALLGGVLVAGCTAEGVPAPSESATRPASATPIATVSDDGAPDPECRAADPRAVGYGLGVIGEAGGKLGYDLGWTAAVQHGDIVAIQGPVYTGDRPTGVVAATVRIRGDLVEDGSGALEVVDPSGAGAAAMGCLERLGNGLPRRPDLACHGPALPAKLSAAVREVYGPAATVTGSATVDAGDGYRVIAVRLRSPGSSRPVDAAWVRDSTGQWLAQVTRRWRGSAAGPPNHRAVVWGQQARKAALGCL